MPLHTNAAELWIVFHTVQTVQLVEMGPGYGTLMNDVLSTCKKFPDFMAAVSCNLVEISPHMRGINTGHNVHSVYSSICYGVRGLY